MREKIEAAIIEARQARTGGRVAQAEKRYADAARLARDAREPMLLAHALRHVSDIARERGSAQLALAAGNEAVALCRSEASPSRLELANALRVAALALQALNNVSGAIPLWLEAQNLYAIVGVTEGVEECKAKLAEIEGHTQRHC